MYYVKWNCKKLRYKLQKKYLTIASWVSTFLVSEVNICLTSGNVKENNDEKESGHHTQYPLKDLGDQFFWKRFKKKFLLNSFSFAEKLSFLSLSLSPFNTARLNWEFYQILQHRAWQWNHTRDSRIDLT